MNSADFLICFSGNPSKVGKFHQNYRINHTFFPFFVCVRINIRGENKYMTWTGSPLLNVNPSKYFSELAHVCTRPARKYASLCLLNPTRRYASTFRIDCHVLAQPSTQVCFHVSDGLALLAQLKLATTFPCLKVSSTPASIYSLTGFFNPSEFLFI